MTRFGRNIRPAVSAELDRAREAELRGDGPAAFSSLERAHVLGQASTREHVRVHLQMLRWGWRHRAPREVLGQVLRIIGAGTLTAFGWVPAGNTGGSNLSPFKPLPVPPELDSLIRAAAQGAAQLP